MKKDSTGGFMLVSILMMVLHIMRGRELSFTINGVFPYVLYYGTIALFVVALLCRAGNILKKKHKKD